jgi:hypothetical protein
VRHRDRAPQLPAIPDDNAPLPPAHAPTRWTVRRGRAISRVLLGLALTAGLLSVYFTYEASQESAAQAAAVDRRLSVLEDDLAERTRQRDAERDAAAARAAQDRELFRVRFCEVLAELSATFPNLDPVERALGCAVPAAAPASAPAAATPASPPAPATSTARPPSPSPPASTSTQAPTSPGPPPSQSSAPPDPPGLICGLLPSLC